MYVVNRFIPDPCAEIPSKGGCSMVAIAPTTGNLLTENAAGELEARLYVAAGNAIVITGNGTSGNPLRVSYEGATAEATVLRSGDSFIVATGSGTAKDPFIIKHAVPASAVAGTYAGFRIDGAGHVIGYDAPDFDGVRGIVGGDGILVTVDPKTGIAAISLAESAVSEVSGSFVFGGFLCEFQKNRLERVERKITVLPGVYQMGEKLVTINEYGSITDVVDVPMNPEPEPEPLPTAFSRVFSTLGDELREIRFTTDKRSAFRITYQSDAIPAGTQLFVDGAEITKYAIGTLRYEAVTPTDYAEGEHVVSLLTQQEGGFLGVGILDVLLVGIGG